MEGDREDLCGPKGCHQVERPAWRGGNVASQVTLGGRQVAVPRLRVRSADGEAPLPSFRWAAATDPLDEHTLAAVAAGVSTRRYAGTLDPTPAEVRSGGRRAARCLGGSWRCQPSACGRFSAGRWASWTCGWSASTARSSGTIAWWSRWGSTRRAASTCWDCAKEPPRRRSSPAACSATWLRAACRRTGRCCSSSTARRGCAGPSPMSAVPRGWCNAAKYTSCATCSAICPNGCTLRSARRCGMPGTSSQRTARRGC